MVGILQNYQLLLDRNTLILDGAVVGGHVPEEHYNNLGYSSKDGLEGTQILQHHFRWSSQKTISTEPEAEKVRVTVVGKMYPADEVKYSEEGCHSYPVQRGKANSMMAQGSKSSASWKEQGIPAGQIQPVGYAELAKVLVQVHSEDQWVVHTRPCKMVGIHPV